MRRSDILLPLPPRFVSLRLAVPPLAPVFGLLQTRRRPAGLELCCLAAPPPASVEVEKTGSPKFLGNPRVPTPCSQTPARPDASGPYDAPARPPSKQQRRLLASINISGLNHTALALAVYASPAGSPQADARLAFRCRPDSTERDWLPAGFQRKVSVMLPKSLPPFPSSLGAMLGSFETYLAKHDVILTSGHGHNRAEQVVRQQVRPDFFFDHVGRLAAQDIHLHRRFDRTQI